MQQAFVAYKKWVRDHPLLVHNIERLLHWAVWIPERFSGSEFTYEAFNSLVGLLGLWHESILQDEVHRAPGPKWSLLLSAIEQLETLVEIRAMQLERKGKMSRYGPLATLELTKLLLRLAIWHHHRGTLSVSLGDQGEEGAAPQEELKKVLNALQRLKDKYEGPEGGSGPHQHRAGRLEDVQPFAHAWRGDVGVGKLAVPGLSAAPWPAQSSLGPHVKGRTKTANWTTSEIAPVEDSGGDDRDLHKNAAVVDGGGDVLQSAGIRVPPTISQIHLHSPRSPSSGSQRLSSPMARRRSASRPADLAVDQSTAEILASSMVDPLPDAVTQARWVVPSPTGSGEPSTGSSQHHSQADEAGPSSSHTAIPRSCPLLSSRSFTSKLTSGIRHHDYAAYVIQTGELLYLVRPLLYVLMLKSMGSSSWRPWLASLGLDALSGVLIHEGHRWKQQDSKLRAGNPSVLYSLACMQVLREVQWSSGEKRELLVRKVKLLRYLLRSPCFDRVTRPALEDIAKRSSWLPLVPSLVGFTLNLLSGIQQYYTYVEST